MSQPPQGDGRLIDLNLGTLSGEASQMHVRRSELPAMPASGDDPGPSYYNRPVLQEPVWIWSIPAYFYAGGVAGGAAILGGAAQWLGEGQFEKLAVRCHWIATGGSVVSAALLIHDLGRPSRFLHMLRVFRPTSPMSVGSWVLSLFGGASFLAAVMPYTPLRGLARLAGAGAALLGMPLASYTAVLVTNTAVPVWSESRRALPFLFIGSAAAATAAFHELLLLPSSEAELSVVKRFGQIGSALESAAIFAVEREAGRVERVGRAYREGLPGALWTAAKVLSISSLALTLLPGKSKAKTVASGVTGTLASLCVRFAVFHAGKRSARDPHATFDLQRS